MTPDIPSLQQELINARTNAKIILTPDEIQAQIDLLTAEYNLRIAQLQTQQIVAQTKIDEELSN